ncbi:MAG: DUF2726 domain-containing protein [Chloroflexi bacterium]|nr:DUF2726 domain-containing protein [Chloroflexota bacterium]
MKENKTDTQRLPYRLREPFLTTTELALFHALKIIVEDRFLVCPKVSLNDIFYIVRPNENVHFFNKFFRKHADFLLCDPQTLAPAFGVEILRQNSKNEARENDKFMAELFIDAGLPLVHVRSSESYDHAELVLLLQLAVAKIDETISTRAANDSESVPQCPVCGKMMVLRIKRTSKNFGKKYYGCMDNPHCAGVVAID